ncbi:SagB/ThcOx family dehydrogenase [Vibrio parahaemolyticus]|uniref:SagB/ThcOx family dehydrogenase n=1 Tax=Vibrio parahaemolyticus TaxID=670 RepID=UPI00330673CF
MKLSDDIFLFYQNKELILWDYGNNNQYIVEDEYFEKLNKFAKSDIIDDDTLSEFDDLGLVDYNQSNPEWGWDKLSKIFHIGTTPNLERRDISPEEAARSFINSCKELEGAPVFFSKKQGESIQLSKPHFGKTQDITLSDALTSRRTIRNFSKIEYIDLDSLSEILFVCFGKQNNYKDKYHYLRTSSSGGGLHPTEPYVVVNRVEGLDRGVYYYHSDDHILIKINEYPENLGSSLMHQYFAEDASCGIILASNFEREQWKYHHSRAYRVCLLDAGHLSQTIQLTCNAYGLSTWISGAFYDNEINKFINADGYRESSLFYIAIGYPGSENARHSEEHNKIIAKETNEHFS